MRKVEFAESAFRHGYQEEDFFELLSGRYIKLKSQRGVADVFELLGQNLAGDYMHVIYRVLSKTRVLKVFHMNPYDRQSKKKIHTID